jgi:predicted N-acetyltransferase YhbS
MLIRNEGIIMADAKNLTLRPEEEKDRRIVEELTREAFWNVYEPGTDVHLLVHKLRECEKFVKDLDFVAVLGDKIVGNIVYAEATVTGADSENKEHTVLTFGPVSVLPEYQNRGIGAKLIELTARLAGEMGYRAILIYGDPGYYGRFGFRVSKEYGITNKDKKYPAALQVLELYPGALSGITGIFDEGDVYRVDRTELAEFEKGFCEKEKAVTESQARFVEMSSRFL